MMPGILDAREKWSSSGSQTPELSFGKSIDQNIDHVDMVNANRVDLVNADQVDMVNADQVYVKIYSPRTL